VDVARLKNGLDPAFILDVQTEFNDFFGDLSEYGYGRSFYLFSAPREGCIHVRGAIVGPESRRWSFTVDVDESDAHEVIDFLLEQIFMIDKRIPRKFRRK
jgi:hypothetical protein